MEEYLESSVVLGRSSTKCLEKILLESLSPDEEASFVYRKYLANTVSFYTAHRSISLLGERELDLFYGGADPLSQPKYFSFFSGGDLSKLESCLGVRIVIVSLFVDKRRRANKWEWQKVHDQRIYDLCRPNSDSAKTIFSYILSRSEADWVLKRAAPTSLHPTLESFFYTPLKAERIFACSAHGISLLSETGCWLSTLASAMQVPLPSSHAHTNDCGSLVRLLALKKEKLRCLMDNQNLVLILASHLRSSVRAKARVMRLVKNNMFAVLKEVSNPGEECESRVPVVSVLADPPGMYLLAEPFAQAVRSGRQQQTSRPPIRRRSDLKRKPNSKDSSKVATKKAAKDQPNKVTFDARLCKCEGCLEGKKYDKNMSATGPQALYKSEMSLTDLLRMCGKLDSKAEKDLERAGNFSIASFDIETFARQLDLSAGNEDLNFEQRKFSSRAIPRQVEATQEIGLIGFQDYRMMLDSEPVQIFEHDPDRPKAVVAKFLESVLERRLEAVALKTGILSELISWVEEYKKAHFSFFVDHGFIFPVETEEQTSSASATNFGTDESDSPDSSDYGSDDDAPSEFDSLAEFPSIDAEYRAKQAQLLAKERRAFSSSTGRSAAAFVKAKEKKATRKIEVAWKSSLFGKVEARLLRLAQAYYVWAINGSSFDFVLLCGQLSVFAKERQVGSVSVQKEGSKLRWLRMAGVRFCEIQHLLFPGTSLASLAKTCNLKIAKGIFPFEKFTSMCFLDQHKLPEKVEEWKSRLNPTKGPSQQEVDEALALFEEKKFENVGDYLRHYLVLDVSILLQCVVAMELEYTKILGLDFIEVGKITVSSLSAAGAQAFLARGKKAGQFSPNHSRLYAVSFQPVRFDNSSIAVITCPLSMLAHQLLKLSSRGGLTACTRSFAGADVDVKPFADLMRRQMAEEMEELGHPGALELLLGERQLGVEDYLTRCNAHLSEVKNPQPSTHAVYIDLGSLYATSGESCKQPRCEIVAGLVLQGLAMLAFAVLFVWLMVLLFCAFE